MLLALKIENFTLIEFLQLELSPGLNVLTGETGAGKSIILDAIDAALGGKVAGRAVRTGHQQASIEATFALPVDLKAWLQSQDLITPDMDTLVCVREIHTNSNRSRFRLNGVPLGKKQMEDLRDRLLEITAQGQTMQLGQANLQRDWLDSFGGQDVWLYRQQVAAAYGEAQALAQKLEQRRRAESDRLQQLDLFQYQIKELAATNLEDPQELDLLLQEQQRLIHAVELQQKSYAVYQALYQNDQGGVACADLLGKAEHCLQEMSTFDPDVNPILEMVSEALTQIEEAGRQINTYGESVETDPDRLREVEARITELKQICRKYGPTLAEVIAHYEHIQRNLALMTGGSESLEELTAAHQAAQTHLQTVCDRLSTLRRQAASQLEQTLIAELKPLAMEKVQFQVQLKSIDPTATGADQITFLFSPNPGEPLQPLGQIASGGEMSRFLLALKACFSQIDPVGTLIFDEIDVGVSGRVSQAIAQKLQQLSQQHQVLCVTHQPLIAALADRHFKVSKIVADDRTFVQVQTLNDRRARSQELAELAGGESAEDALAFAESLLAQATLTNEAQSDEAQTNDRPQEVTEVSSGLGVSLDAESADSGALSTKSKAKDRKTKAATGADRSSKTSSRRPSSGRGKGQKSPK
jgi:DNA repair protein RecN (Recombination protein N)